MRIAVVGPADLPELLPLMRAYCDFYQVAPEDQALLTLSQALLADPQREGLQLLARDAAGRAVGFATLYWTWQTLAAARVGVMNDLYVAGEARGIGVADGLIAACLERCREHGATQLIWQTARDNHRAQAVYDRIGATREDQWTDRLYLSLDASLDEGDWLMSREISPGDMRLLAYFVSDEPRAVGTMREPASRATSMKRCPAAAQGG